MTRLVLDTSVLIGGWPPSAEAAVSTVSVAELHGGVALAPSPAERETRTARLDDVLAHYRVLALDLRVARTFGDLLALSRRLGTGPGNRADLFIAATAVAHDAGLATADRRLAAFARAAGLEVVEPPTG